MARGVALALLLLLLGGCAAPQGPATATDGTASTATPTASRAPTPTLQSPDRSLAACPGFEAEAAQRWTESVRIGAGVAWNQTGDQAQVAMRPGESRTFAVDFTFVRAVPAGAYNLTWHDDQDGRAPYTITGPARLEVGTPCAPIRLNATATATEGDPTIPAYIGVRIGWRHSTDRKSVLIGHDWD